MPPVIDVCVRGAGIVGRTLALLLARERLRVGLVEGRPPEGESDVGDRKSNRMSTSIAHVWGVSGMHTGDCWVDFSKPVARDFSV